MHIHEIYACEHKHSLKQIARCCRLEETKPKKKAGKGGLRCLWGKRLLINTYCISSPITSLASLIKKDAPFAPFHPWSARRCLFYGRRKGLTPSLSPALICLKIGITVKWELNRTALTSPTLWVLKLFRSPQQRIIYYKREWWTKNL